MPVTVSDVTDAPEEAFTDTPQDSGSIGSTAKTLTVRIDSNVLTLQYTTSQCLVLDPVNPANPPLQTYTYSGLPQTIVLSYGGRYTEVQLT